MTETLYNCVYLSEEEFLMLAAAAGLEQIEGVFYGSRADLTEREICEAMFSLYRRGLMEVEMGQEGAYFRPAQVLRSLFQTLRKARRTMLYARKTSSEPTLICYLSDQTLLCEVSSQPGGRLRIFSLPGKDLEGWLFAEGYRPCRTVSAEEASLPPELSS